MNGGCVAPHPRRSPLADRLGPAVLGLFGGLVVGFGVGLLMQAGHPGTTWVATGVFGGAALGALLGALSSNLAFGLFEGIVHLLVGMVAGGAVGVHDDEAPLRPSASAPRWLRGVFWLGAALALAALILLRWH